MSSEIKVDTISENTSANGVTIDGVKLKDNVVTVQGTSTTGGTIEIENTDTGGAANDYFGKLIFKGNDSSSSASGTRASVEGKVTGNFGSSQIDFLTASGGAAASRIATVSPDGLSLADGNITFEGSGHGIHLGVTSATAANLLDDYEEGTFTASYGSSGSNTGYYTKIGRVVTINFTITGTSQTFNEITGLPFSSDLATGSVTFGRLLSVGTNKDRSVVGGNTSSTSIFLYDENATTSNLSTGSGTVRLDITVVYITNS